MDYKKIITDIYEQFLQEKYHEYLKVDDNLGREFMAEVCELEKKMIHLSSMPKPITKLEHLNIKIIEDLKVNWESKSLTSPVLVRSYGRIFVFLLPLINKYDKSVIGLTIFNNNGGN